MLLGRRAWMVSLSFALVCSVLGGLSYMLYRGKVKDSELHGTMYFRSLVLERVVPGSTDEVSEMQRIAQESKSGYRSLANLRLASAKLKDGDLHAATAIYQELLSDKSNDRFFKDYVTYILAMSYADSGEYDKLKKLSMAESSFKPYIIEVLGLALLRSGDSIEALRIFQELLDDSETPNDLRRRAAEIKGYIS